MENKEVTKRISNEEAERITNEVLGKFEELDLDYDRVSINVQVSFDNGYHGTRKVGRSDIMLMGMVPDLRSMAESFGMSDASFLDMIKEINEDIDQMIDEVEDEEGLDSSVVANKYISDVKDPRNAEALRNLLEKYRHKAMLDSLLGLESIFGPIGPNCEECPACDDCDLPSAVAYREKKESK